MANTWLLSATVPGSLPIVCILLSEFTLLWSSTSLIPGTTIASAAAPIMRFIPVAAITAPSRSMPTKPRAADCPETDDEPPHSVQPGDPMNPSEPSSLPPPPPAGVYNELTDGDDQIRPHWKPLLESLQRLGSEELNARQEQCQRVIREHGATYNVYADRDRLGRPWSLDLLPLVISSTEWRQIEAGLIQRSHLLDSILGDIYGPQQLLRHGVLPPALLFANPGFLRPCHGIRPLSGRFLFLHAVDLARGANGSWWVLADRTQAPSGAGYTL